MSVNQMMGYFANSSIKFVNIFRARHSPFQVDTGRRTAQGVCGLVIPLKGFASFSLNGIEYEMNGQTILHAGSRMDIHIETFASEWEYVVVHYQVIHAPTEYQNMSNQHFLLTVNEQLDMEKSIQYLLQNQTQPDYMSKLQVQNEFMRLLELILLSARNGRFENKKDAMLSALEYLKVHYAEELVIGELAERIGMKRRRFSYLFEQLTGLSPIEYLTEYRISQAKELLTSTDFSVAKIAEKVGYMDSFYFSRVFKKNTNISPSMYRKQYQKSTYSSI
ncbi:MmsAB operon regulatory protein [Mycobacteroides abscessus subsp. abscessus]|nr:MmsAB operon regulatory protein [Mycobacteroides abscessus subsp. abscessus]